MNKIEEDTLQVVNSEGFYSISKKTLALVLSSDKLKIDELKLFEACFDWARQRADSDYYDTIAEALGECRTKFRFLSIPSKSFTDEVCTKNVLTPGEQLEIFKCMTSPQKATEPNWLNRQPRKPSEYLHMNRALIVRTI